MTSRKRADEIFRDVCDLSPDERRVSLDATCGDDEELRAEVEELLAADARWGDARKMTTDGAGAASAPSLLGKLLRGPGPLLDDALPAAVGPFAVERLIGRGGMGVVYEARDTRLGRRVALKVLPETFLRDPERRSRFEREATTLASLNHPRIGAIYGIEETEGRSVLVLELVPGEDLRERLDRGPLPVDQAIEVCAQIADGLEAAHERGVIHRDLKPANIKLGSDGQVKILDFGIAKRIDGADDPAEGSSLANDETEPGAIIGTVSYMSPEQARGRPVDRRTDVWAFGCCLYECLVGKPAFSEPSTAETLSAVLRQDPDWERLPADTPPSIRLLLRKCLRRDPRRRLRDIGDARVELEDAPDYPLPAESARSGESVSASRMPGRRGLAVGGACGLLIGLLVFLFAPSRAPPADPFRKLELPVDVVLDRGLVGASRFPVISPDDRKLVYAGDGRLWWRDLQQFRAGELRGTEGAHKAFWSPDSLQIGFFLDDGLWRTTSDALRPTQITVLGDHHLFSSAAGAAWMKDDRVLYTLGKPGTPLMEVSARGGIPRVVLEVDAGAGEGSFEDLSPLPDGLGVAFTIQRGGDDEALAVFDGEKKIVFEAPGENLDSPVYCARSGHLLYRRETIHPGIWAFPFDLDRLERTGAPFVVCSGGGLPSVSAAGTLVYDSLSAVPPTQLVWVDRAGKIAETIGGPQEAHYFPELSRDGQRVAIGAMSRGRSVVDVYDVGPGTRVRLAGEKACSFPVWFPSGQKLAGMRPTTPPTLIVLPTDGSPPVEMPHRVVPRSFDPDGRWLACEAWATAGGKDTREIVLLRLTESGDFSAPPERIVADATHARISPDGHLLAYVSHQSGHNEVYLTRFPSGEGRWRVPSSGGMLPRWGREGRELFFVQENRVLSVAVEPSREAPLDVRIGAPQVLFDATPLAIDLASFGYDVDREGARFLALQAVQLEASSDRIAYVPNWFEEFGRNE